MMKYFKSGLSKDELKDEYKRLAKMYHPDVCKLPNATEIMQDINKEYDQYFVAIHKSFLGFDYDDLINRYKEAQRSRDAILMFLRYDKNSGGGWFGTRKAGGCWGYHDVWKYHSDDDPEWEKFKGGFKVVIPQRDLFGLSGSDYTMSPVPAVLECPTLADMYYAMLGQCGDSNSTGLQTNAYSTNGADVSRYGSYEHIRTKRYGDMWVEGEEAFMKVNGMVMSTYIPPYVRRDSELIEAFNGIDFGFLMYQECTFEEFCRTHDVDYAPRFSDRIHCKALNTQKVLWSDSRQAETSDFLWIDDPLVAHFARTGLVRFYESGMNFRVRYGTFDKEQLTRHIHELSIDDVEQIQDFLDDINEEFEEHIKTLIKRGRLRIA